MSLEFTIGSIPQSRSRKRRRKPQSRPSRAVMPLPTSLRCPNCNVRFSASSHSRLYCGLACAHEASTVRYARKKWREFPNGMPKDINYAIRIRLAQTLSGGYDKAARLLKPAIRQAVFTPDQGRCVSCGATGEEIDHIHGPSSDLTNLRVLCKSCHQTITEQHLAPISDTETLDHRDRLMARIHSLSPLLPSDSEVWCSNWRTWRREHASFD